MLLRKGSRIIKERSVLSSLLFSYELLISIPFTFMSALRLYIVVNRYCLAVLQVSGRKQYTPSLTCFGEETCVCLNMSLFDRTRFMPWF